MLHSCSRTSPTCLPRVCFIATAVRRSHSTCYYYYCMTPWFLLTPPVMKSWIIPCTDCIHSYSSMINASQWRFHHLTLCWIHTNIDRNKISKSAGTIYSYDWANNWVAASYFGPLCILCDESVSTVDAAAAEGRQYYRFSTATQCRIIHHRYSKTYITRSSLYGAAYAAFYQYSALSRVYSSPTAKDLK